MAAVDISVIVPTFERINALEGCLRALALQTLPLSQFEVIVCDDGSRQPIREALAPTLERLAGSVRVHVLRQPNRGPAAARNCGAAAAAGRYLAFTDDDCRPEPHWLSRLLDQFAVRPDALVGGGLRVAAGADRYARATQAIMDFVYAEQERRNAVRVFSTSNLALPADGFKRLGGFSATFTRAAGEDYDLCVRWYGTGGQSVYLPDAIVVHDHALTLSAYCLQHFTYGRGLLKVRQRLWRMGESMRTGSLPGIFHLRLITSPLVREGARGAACAALVGLAQAATTAGAVVELTAPTSRPKALESAGLS